MMLCNVCANSSLSCIYESPDDLSITTMNRLISGKTRLYFCEQCGHLQTSELPNLVEYYAQEYAINLASEEEDQLYKMVDGKPVYRAEHQAAILMAKVKFAAGCRVLDYGCAQSPTLKKVLTAHPDIEPFLFDVTDKYVALWQKFPKMPQWAVHQPNSAWNGSMDVVLSFYALEHVANLGEAIGNIKALLKPGGTFYFLVPNVYQNTADFIVADHINHFSESALRVLLQSQGFENIEIDDESHEAAFVVSAQLAGGRVRVERAVTAHIEVYRQAALEMADYWKNIVGKIQAFEASIGTGLAAVYGAGFYGSFIALTMKHFERTQCIVDQNKHLQGTQLHGKKIISPDELPENVTHLLVGMNPRNARANIETIAAWKNRKLTTLFL